MREGYGSLPMVTMDEPDHIYEDGGILYENGMITHVGGQRGHNPKARFHEPVLAKGATISTGTAMRRLERHGNQ